MDNRRAIRALQEARFAQEREETKVVIYGYIFTVWMLSMFVSYLSIGLKADFVICAGVATCLAIGVACLVRLYCRNYEYLPQCMKKGTPNQDAHDLDLSIAIDDASQLPDPLKKVLRLSERWRAEA